MKRSGQIVALIADGRASVELDQAAACARCAAGRGCGAALFAPRGKPLILPCQIPASATVSPGQRVDITLFDGEGESDESCMAESGSGWLVPVALAYGLPTAGLVAGVLAPEPWTPFAALVGLIGGVLAWRTIARQGRLVRPGMLDARIACVHPVIELASSGRETPSGDLP